MKNLKLELLFKSFGSRGFFKRLILHYEKEILELYNNHYTIGLIMEEIIALVKKEYPEVDEKKLNWKYPTFYPVMKKNLNLQKKTTNISPTPIVNLETPPKINLRNDFKEKNTLEIPADYVLKRMNQKHFDEIVFDISKYDLGNASYYLPYLVFAFENYIVNKINLSLNIYYRLDSYKKEALEIFMCNTMDWNFENPNVLQKIEKVKNIIKSFKS